MADHRAVPHRSPPPDRRQSPWRRVARRAAAAAIAVSLGAIVGTLTYEMSLQPGAALVKAAFEAKPLVTPPKHFAATVRDVGPAQRVSLASGDAPVAHLDIYEPTAAGATARPMVLWVHGGGFISTDAASIKDYAEMLAAAGYVVGSLDYSLAPGAKHPVPVLQAEAGLRYLRTHAAALDGDAGRIVIGGDSAGAQIASETAAAETSPALGSALGIAAPVAADRLRGVVLFCGLYDMQTVASTDFPALRTYLWAYTGYADWLMSPDIQELSTTAQATADYPATFLSVGNDDPFRTQATELAADLRRKGVSVDTLFWQGSALHLSHEYQFDFDLPQASTAFARTVAFLDDVEGS